MLTTLGGKTFLVLYTSFSVSVELNNVRFNFALLIYVARTFLYLINLLDLCLVEANLGQLLREPEAIYQLASQQGVTSLL